MHLLIISTHAPTQATQSTTVTKLSRQRLWCVALIRAHRHSIHKLLISIGGVDDVGLIRDAQSGEAMVSPELVAPSTADRVGAADLAGVGLRGGGRAVDGVGARGLGPSVDSEGDVTGTIVGVAGTGEGLDRPFTGRGCHHGFRRVGRGREGGRGGEEERRGELHLGLIGFDRFGGLCDLCDF